MNYRLCFSAFLRQQAKSPATVKSYSHALDEYISYCRSTRKRSLLKSFNPENLEAYKEHLLINRGLRPSTVNRRLTGLSTFARFLLVRGLLTYNPLELVARVRSDGTSNVRRRAAWEDVQSLRREIHQDFFDLRGRLVVELLYAGISMNEIRELRYDETAGTESIKVGERLIMLHPEARLALEHYRILRPILLGEHLIVDSGEGWSLKPGTVYYVLQKFSRIIGARVGVRDLRLAQFAPAPALATPSAADDLAA